MEEKLNLIIEKLNSLEKKTEKIDDIEKCITHLTTTTNNLDFKFTKLLESQKQLLAGQENLVKSNEQTLKLCEIILAQQSEDNKEISIKVDKMLSHIDYLVKSQEDIKQENTVLSYKTTNHEDRITALEEKLLLE